MPELSIIKEDIQGLELRTDRSLLGVLVPSRFLNWFSSGEEEDLLVERMDELEKVYQVFDKSVKKKTGFESYLSSQELSRLEDDAEKVVEIMVELDSRSWSFKVNDYLIQRFEEIKSGLVERVRFLENYNEVFVERELEKYGYLFKKGEYSLNEAQKKAVVRNDTFNQVVAGAGAGKTLVLTYRIAYLVEKGVEPGKIAALTLTNDARDEIEDRLSENFGIEDVEVETFHAFGNKFVQQSGRKTTIDEKDRENFVADQMENLEDGIFERHLRNFLYLMDSDAVSREDFESVEEFIEARKDANYETLRGETVASRGEKFIADFLFTHDIDYRHEDIAEWAESSEDRSAYRPDFYLPGHDVYIEHWGIDEDGEVPEWFSWSTGEYKKKMRWARRQFENSRYELVETYDSEYRNSDFEKMLFERLRENGVAPERLDLGELIEQVNEGRNGLKRVKKEFNRFIETAKTFDTSPEELEQRLRNEGDARKYHFGSAGKILLERYEAWKKNNGFIDFQDQIYNAIERIESNPAKFNSLYDHLLVDEFQDVAMGQIRLVKGLTGENSANLFCVGDDWQSIYGFRGAVVDYFIDFREYFGEATRTDLVKNYRSVPPIVETGNRLIRGNPRQLEKQLEPVRKGSKEPRLHTVDGYTKGEYGRNMARRAAEIARKYIRDGSKPGEIMVLSRLDAATYLTDLVRDEFRKQGIPLEGKNRPGVKVMSAHSSKGREARHVVLIHAVEDHGGFSPESRESDLTNIARDIKVNTEAEERRLFYVAITRAEDTLDILTKAGEESVFLDDVSGSLVNIRSAVNPGRIGEEVDIVAGVDRLWQDTHEDIAQAGLLKDSTGSIKFTSWKNKNPPLLEPRKAYLFRNIKVTDWKGDKQLEFTGRTEIDEIN